MRAISVLTTLFQDFAARLCSTEFLHDARHSDHPTAFSRCRKLPLATLVAIMLTGMRMSIQAELDTFFAHLRQQAQLVHEVFEQAFSQARAELSLTKRAAFADQILFGLFLPGSGLMLAAFLYSVQERGERQFLIEHLDRRSQDDLYHKRWGIEGAFKRLKHRLNLEHVTGLTQQAVVQDVAAQIVCNNLQALVALKPPMPGQKNC